MHQSYRAPKQETENVITRPVSLSVSNSRTYMVHDRSHVFIRWRRADQVYELAKEYLQASLKGIASSHPTATHACQDLIDLKLLRWVENNEMKR